MRGRKRSTFIVHGLSGEIGRLCFRWHHRTFAHLCKLGQGGGRSFGRNHDGYVHGSSATAKQRSRCGAGGSQGAICRSPPRRAPGSISAHASVLPGGNTRSVLFYTPFPTAMVRGEGCFLEDVDGHRYVDFCGEYTAGLFGHSEPRIQAALHAAIDRGLNLASVGEREGQLAALLCARFPSLERVRFTNSGTEANMMALGAARAFSGRPAHPCVQRRLPRRIVDACRWRKSDQFAHTRHAGRLQRH